MGIPGEGTGQRRQGVKVKGLEEARQWGGVGQERRGRRAGPSAGLRGGRGGGGGGGGRRVSPRACSRS